MIGKAIKKFKAMSKSRKAELIVASLLTLALAVSIPVYAWFGNSRNLETMTKIKEPGEIIMRAGNGDPIVNFEMRDIDIESISKGHPQMFVFSVKPGEYNRRYYLQLAHTTNIPFTYTLYKASRVPDSVVNPSGGSGSASSIPEVNLSNFALYYPKDDPSDKTYYQKADETAITMTPLNEDDGTAYGRKIAEQSGTYYDLTYSRGDEPEIYAVPVYSQSEQLEHPEDAPEEFDYYILQLSWEKSEDPESAFKKWNEAANNKETDIVYITASKSLN